MVLRLLAHNAEHWLANCLNAYLRDDDEYRDTTRETIIRGLAGTITFTPATITVTLEPPGEPRVNGLSPCFSTRSTTPRPSSPVITGRSPTESHSKRYSNRAEAALRNRPPQNHPLHQIRAASLGTPLTASVAAEEENPTEPLFKTKKYRLRNNHRTANQTCLTVVSDKGNRSHRWGPSMALWTSATWTISWRAARPAVLPPAPGMPISSSRPCRALSPGWNGNSGYRCSTAVSHRWP